MTKKYLTTAMILVLAGALAPLCVKAQTVLINPTTLNGSFENNSSKTDFSTGLVPNWTFWTNGVDIVTDTDSGTDVSAAATQGTRDAFLEGGSGAYDLTSYVIQSGDTFTYTWDWALTGRGVANVELGYWNGTSFIGIASTETSAQSNTGSVLGNTFTYTALPTDSTGGADIGDEVGIAVWAPSGSNYPEVDNFVLTVTPVPEPSVAALGGLGGLGTLLLLKRKLFIR